MSDIYQCITKVEIESLYIGTARVYIRIMNEVAICSGAVGLLYIQGKKYDIMCGN